MKNQLASQVEMPDMHAEFHDALDKIELGLEAFERLLALSKGMSKVLSDFDVLEEVEEAYNQHEGQQYWKDFVKVGLEFVRGHPDASHLEFNVKAKKVEASGQEGKDLVENGLESDNIIKEKVQVEVNDEVTTEENLNLSQVEKSPANLHDDLKETSTNLCRRMRR